MMPQISSRQKLQGHFHWTQNMKEEHKYSYNFIPVWSDSGPMWTDAFRAVNHISQTLCMKHELRKIYF